MLSAYLRSHVRPSPALRAAECLRVHLDRRESEIRDLELELGVKEQIFWESSSGVCQWKVELGARSERRCGLPGGVTQYQA